MPLAAATDEWAAALAPRLAAGDTWFSAPWFLVENYLYKRMLELTDGPSGGRLPSKSNPSPNPNPNLTLTLALVLALALAVSPSPSPNQVRAWTDALQNRSAYEITTATSLKMSV